MTRTILADTGPLYAALDPDDDHHRRAQLDIQRLNRAGLAVTIPYSTLLEAYSLVLYKLGIRTAHAWLGEVSNSALLVNPAVEDYQQSQQLLLAFRDQPLSHFDAVLAVLSQRLHVPVWSYGHHFDVMRVSVWRE